MNYSKNIAYQIITTTQNYITDNCGPLMKFIFNQDVCNNFERYYSDSLEDLEFYAHFGYLYLKNINISGYHTYIISLAIVSESDRKSTKER